MKEYCYKVKSNLLKVEFKGIYYKKPLIENYGFYPVQQDFEDEKGNKIDFKGYRADKINNFAIEYIENHNNDKPFFLFISQLEPHHQNDHKRFEGPKEKVKK